MNGIEKIKERILADGKAEVEAIKAETAEKCGGITKAYEAEAKLEYERLRALAEQEAQQRCDLLHGVAGLEAKKQILALKQEKISRAFELAEEKLYALPEDAYIAFVARLAAAASRSGEEKVLLSETDRDKLGKKIVAEANALLVKAGRKASLTLDAGAAAIQGGVILLDGRVESNCSIASLIALRRGELAAEAAKVLF